MLGQPQYGQPQYGQPQFQEPSPPLYYLPQQTGPNVINLVRNHSSGSICPVCKT